MTDTTKIYLVKGEHGEHSDHTEWIVKAFTSKASAEALIAEIEKRVAAIPQRPLYMLNEPHNERMIRWEKWQAESEPFKRAVRELDPECDPYSDNSWFVVETELLTNDV